MAPPRAPRLLTTPSCTDTSVNRISTKNLKRLSRSDISPSGKYHLPFRIDDSKNTGAIVHAEVHAIIVADSGREELETISEAKWRTKRADTCKLALPQNRNGKDVRLKVLIQKPKNNFTPSLIYISQRNLAPHFELLYKRELKKVYDD